MNCNARVAVAVLAAWAAGLGAASAQPLAVSVASSLADVMDEVGRAFEAGGGSGVRLNIAGSNVLARQIAAGARVDVFVSADDAQMKVAGKSGRLVPGSRRNFLTNTLVVIVPATSTVAVAGAADLAAPGMRRIAIGNPDSVPVGVYTRQWLEGQGSWTAVSRKVIPTLTARAALAAVRADRVDAGVVFATDARGVADVRVAYHVPAHEVPPVRYVVAAVEGPRQAESEAFIAFLLGARARAIFEGAGFGTMPQP
jgi:molybdate transport system substrate-binding protein